MSRALILKLSLALLLCALVGTAYLWDLDRYVTLAAIQDRRHALEQYYAQSPIFTLTLFALTYVAVAALALPGASVLTLTAGALFGFWPALVVVALASNVGGTISFWLTRYLLRDTVQRRFASQLRQINAGLAAEGPMYLFALRLIPIFPFFVVNALMGLTQLRSSTYIWVSQLGMLPATAVFVYAGRQIGQLQSVSDVVSWKLLSALIALGLLPIVSRQILNAYRKNRSSTT